MRRIPFMHTRTDTLLTVTVVVVAMVFCLLGGSAAFAPAVMGGTGRGPSIHEPFEDIASSPYRDAIIGVWERGIISGFGDDTFGPELLVMRQQFAKMIVLSLGLGAMPADACPFGDVELVWPYPRGFVAAAAHHLITIGTTSTTFSPWASITRAQLVTMVVRAYENLHPGTLAPPPSVGDYPGSLEPFSLDHAENTRKAEYNGLLAGLQGFGYAWNPWQHATRGEVAQILWNALRLQETPRWRVVDANNDRTMAVRRDGSLWAWGYNQHGQLGDGTTEDRHLPTRIGTDSDWKTVAAGGYGGCHSVAIKIDGSLWAWGGNQDGQLGDGTTEDRHLPTRIGTHSDWKTVAAGGYCTLAIKNDGSLWAWGHNGDGRLGIGGAGNQLVPTRVGSDSDWIVVATKSSSSLGVKGDGSLWAWGANRCGQLGDGTTEARWVPTRVGMGSDWKAVAAGQESSLAVKTDGSLWAWGLNYHGQLGDGTATDRHAPTRIGTDVDWAAVSGGADHALAVKIDGSLWAWGGNGAGQLGDGTATDRLIPTRIGTDSDWIAVTAGRNYYSSGIRANGTLWAWGSNEYGQLGDGTTIRSLVPKLVTGLY